MTHFSFLKMILKFKNTNPKGKIDYYKLCANFSVCDLASQCCTDLKEMKWKVS